MGVHLVAENLIADGIVKKAKGDVLTRSSVRHDSEKMAEIVWNLIK